MHMISRGSACLPALFLFALVFLPPVQAGGWTLDQGEWQISFDVIHTRFDRAKKFDGSTAKPGAAEIVSTGLSFDFGLYDYLTLYATVPYETSSRDGTATGPSLDRRKGENGLGDGTFGFRIRCFDEFDNAPLTIGISGGIRTPLSNYDEYKLHSFGDGQTDIEIKLGLGRMFQFAGLDHYVSLDGGYRWRLGDPADEIFGYVEIGTFVNSDFTVRAFADTIDSRGGLGLESPAFSAEAATTGFPPFPKVEEDLTRVGGGLSYRVIDGASATFFYAQTIDAENTSLDTVVGVGIVLER